MINYESFKFGKSTIYKVIHENSNGEVTRTTEIETPLYTIRKDGFDYLILLDDSGRVIHQAFSFLNKKMKSSPYNTRSRYASAIRTLYCWLAMSNYDINNLHQEEIDELIAFLKGYAINVTEIEDRKIRSNTSVNNDLAAIRMYIEFIGVECSPLFDTRATHEMLTMNAKYPVPKSIKSESYKSNLSTGPDSIPKYVRPDEFAKLYSIASKHKDRTAKMLMHLMYGYGLRLGECLGLTLEDIHEVKRDKKFVACIEIRNRVSDNEKFQSAKNKGHPRTKAEYQTSSYQQDRDIIYITHDFYQQLTEYINDYIGELADKYPDNFEKSQADIVTRRFKKNGFNCYIFLNRYARVLSGATWNYTLRKYFREAGIELDYKERGSNLSHRFRHGFAMFHAQFSSNKWDALKLSKRMRHKSIASTMIYYTPTAEDEAKVKEDWTSYLYELVPELKL